MKDLMDRMVMLVMSCFLLASCEMSDPSATAKTIAAGGVTLPATAIPTEEGQEPTKRPIATEQPSPQITERPHLSPPSLPDWAVDDYFFGATPQNCKLPCWQGLIVGKSKGADIESVFDTVFHFNGTASFVLADPDRAFLKTDSAYARGYVWLLDSDERHFINIIIWMEKSTNILQGIEFRSSHNSLNKSDSNMSVARIIKELGMPLSMMTSIQITESGATVVTTLVLVYQQGMTFRADLATPVSIVQGESITELCMDGEIWNGNSNASTRIAMITEPFSSSLSDLSPIQDHLIGSTLENLVSFETLFGATAEEVELQVLQGKPACFTAKVFGH